jgi:predicted nuclease with TOPRIM domain
MTKEESRIKLLEKIAVLSKADMDIRKELSSIHAKAQELSKEEQKLIEWLQANQRAQETYQEKLEMLSEID